MIGPFRIRVSADAEKLDYDALEEQIRDVLCHGQTFDSKGHEVYRFFVIPEFDFSEGVDHPSRKRKKRDYSRADRALVHAERDSPSIKLLGMYPVSQDEGGQLDLDLEGC